jgi:hypothetical protein
MTTSLIQNFRLAGALDVSSVKLLRSPTKLAFDFVVIRPNDV